MKRNQKCTRCSLHEHVKEGRRCVWGRGNLKAPLVIIGEAPGWEEHRSGKAFVGQAGKLLDHVIQKLGISWRGLYVTNVFKCRPLENTLPSSGEQEKCWVKCKPYFNEELKGRKSPILLVLGNTALKHITGLGYISRQEGREVSPGVFAGYHPAAVLRNPGLEPSLALAITKAARAAKLKVNPIGGAHYDYPIKTYG